MPDRPLPRPLLSLLHRAVAAAAVTSTTLAFVLAAAALAPTAGPAPEHDARTRPASPGNRSAIALTARHGCWRDRAGVPPDMEGRLPGHVVVTRPGATSATYSARLVGPALDHVFGTRRVPGLRVHAFCR